MTEQEKVLIKLLLAEVANLPKDLMFNTFRLLEVHQRETIMCRFFAELLKPTGVHGEGRKYIDLFFDMVLDVKRSTKPSPQAEINVVEEQYTENKRRIDIVLKYDNCAVPIEVKIRAGDQKNQCSDYLAYAENSPLYYLTIDGDKPENDEYYESMKDDIILISWREHALPWLNACIKQTAKTEQNLQFHDILCQYAKAVDAFVYGDDAVKRAINSNPEYEQIAGKISLAYHTFLEKSAGYEEIIEIFQSSTTCKDAASRIYASYTPPEIKAVPIEKLDEKLQKEKGLVLHSKEKRNRTYVTGKQVNGEEVFLRLQYKSNESRDLAVCFIVKRGKGFGGLNGRWNFEIISGEENFDALYGDVYLNACVDKVVKKLEELN